MKVILLTDIKNLGKKNEIKEVANGYAAHLARNNQIVEATKENLAKLEKQNQAEAAKAEQLKEAAIKMKTEIEKNKVVFLLKAGADNRVFGKITTKQIAEELAKKGYKVDKRKFLTHPTLSALGSTTLELELYKGVICKVEVELKAK